MDLETLVKKFKSEGGEPTPDSLLEYAQQIQNFFSGSPDPSKLDSYLGLAFPEPTSNEGGLLGFLKRKITEKKYDKIKELMFNLIQFVLVQRGWRQDVDRFCIRFKVIADMFWKNPKESARVQQAALDCLISLFENFGQRLDFDAEGEENYELPKLYWELLTRSEKSSFQPTVRGKMFHLLGIIGHLLYSDFTSQSGRAKQLFNHFIATVKSQVTSSDAHLEVSILHGCMKGMGRLLNDYREEVTISDAAWLEFQDYLERIVDPACSLIKEGGKAKIKRREFQRAALELVANHGNLLEVGLFKKYTMWYEDLMVWSKSPNADDNRIGRKAMYRFLDTVVEYAKQFLDLDDSSSGSQTNRLTRFFDFFVAKFKTVLSMKDANKIELGIAVRGFGLLSHLSSEQNQCREMFDLIIKHINSIVHELDSPNIDKYSGTIAFLPTYLESGASIIPSLQYNESTGESTIAGTDLDSLKKLAVLLIRFYPDLSENQRNFCYISVQKLFDSFWLHHHLICEPFIEQVYQQSLLHIVSGPTRAEIDILVESWTKVNPQSKKSPVNQLGLKPVTWYVQFWRLLLSRGTSNSAPLQFDLLMRWMLSTIGKLDLTITFESTEADSTLDPVEGATPSVAKDFQIFINIVDFLQAFMSEKDLQTKFEKWIPTFSLEMLAYIKNHAYVSGFYKILAVVFDAARTLHYFDLEDSERSDLLEKLNIFLKHLGTKIKEFRDDLLFAVLELWLSLPESLILANFDALNHTLQTVFITGKSSFPLAIHGLEAVERWFLQPKFPVDEIKSILKTIFPILKTYFTHCSTTENDEEAAKDKKHTNHGNLKKLIKKNVQTKRYKDDDANLKTVQQKILKLLGTFGQFINIEEKQHSGLSKDQRFLHYPIPFKDCKPEFFIDDLLPRVIDLCENTVDRQTRISACEFLHTLTLIFIGKSTGSDDKTKLFREIFQIILKLGCDSDIVVRQLFNPLCLQTIHWFSKRNSPYGTTVMDILTENLTQFEDQSLRELSAMCTGEYFSWVLRQSFETTTTDPKAKQVLKTILALSTHASPNCRQGSVLAFNSVYQEFRENTVMVSEYTFNLLFSFLTSLKLSKDLPDDSLLITSTKQSIKHLERILVKKRDRFNTALSRQFRPLIGKDKNPCLRDIVEWLLQQGGSDAVVYREECLRLVSVLSMSVKETTKGGVLIAGFGSTRQCLTLWQEAHGGDCWIQIAEGTLKHQRRSLADQITFLDASSCFYSFLFANESLTRSIFSANSRSDFCRTLIDVVQHCASTQNSALTEEEKIRLLRVFSRLKFACKFFDAETLKVLWKYSIELSKGISHMLNSDITNSLTNVWTFGEFSPSMKSKCRPLVFFEPEEILSLNSDQIPSVLNQSLWYRQVAECRLIKTILSEEDVQILREKLWNSLCQALFKPKTSTTQTQSMRELEANDLKINELKIVENYLIIALHLGLDHKLLVEAAFDSTSTTHKDGSFQLVTTKGRVFQKQLMNAIVYCNAFFEFETLVTEQSYKDVGELIQRLLDLMKSDKALRKKFGEIVFSKTLNQWRMISNNCDFQTTTKIFIGLLAVDIEACKNSEELVKWWSGEKLSNAPNLDLKQKAEVLGYANVFALSRNKKITDNVVTAVSTLIEKELNPTESWSEVEQYVTHIFGKILKVFEQLTISKASTTGTNPSNLALLKPILTTVEKVSRWLPDLQDHLIFRAASEALEKAVKTQIQIDIRRVELASELYGIITSTNAGNCKFIESIPVWKFCLLPVVSSLNFNATKNFFKKHIYDIIKKMEKQAKNLYDWRLKTLAVHLLELLIYQTNGDFIRGGELSSAYISSATPTEKAELESKAETERLKIVYRSIIQVCLNGIIKTSIPTDEDVLRKCIFNCHEACYNTLVATLIVTKAEFRFCDNFLFPGKKLFENLVETNIAYEFPLMVDEEKHKEGVRSYRKKTSAESAETGFLNILPVSGNLTGSSLAPEATSYDFTTAVTVSNTEFYQSVLENQAAGDGGQAGNEVKLEWNEVNQHGCMFAFVETLNRMGEFHRNKEDIGKDPKTGGDILKWPATISKILTDSKVHKNIKTFIVGGIINTPEAVKPFAATLTEPIIQLIFTDCFGSVGLNHFVQDVIITLLSWNRVDGAKPSEASVTRLLNYILQHVKNEEIVKRKDIFGYIMGILQSIIKFWTPTTSLISQDEIITSLENKTQENSTLMMDVWYNFLLGGQLPQGNISVIMKKFFQACSSRFKAVHYNAAKCIGLLLKKMKEDAPEFLEEHLKVATNKLTNCAKSKPSVFVDILTGIQKHFADIMPLVRETIMELCQMSKLRSEVLSLLPLLLNQQLQLTTEETFQISPQRSVADDFFVDIDGRKVFENPCKTDEELAAGLNLVEMLIDKSSYGKKLLKTVDWILSAESTTNSKIKVQFAICLTKLYKKIVEEAERSEEPVDPNVEQLFLKIFIKMFDDEDEEVHKEVNMFWEHVLAGPARPDKSTSDILLELFELIGQEEHPLNVCLGLILKRCSLSPDYNKKIFQHPLAQCTFQKFQLDTSWRLRNSSFQPLFSESLSSAKNFSLLPRTLQSSLLSQRRTVGKYGMNMLKATMANLQFTPTQRQEFDDSIEDRRMEIDDFDNFRFDSLNPRQMISDGSRIDSNPNPETANGSSLGESNPVLKLRKKFYMRKNSVFYAARTVEAISERKEATRELKMSKMSGVKTVRSYRIGDLPDIEISHADVLNTLLKLAKQDPILGQQFLIYLYKGLHQEMDMNGRKLFLAKSNEIFNRVLRNTVASSDRSFLSLLMELSVSNGIPIQLNVALEVCRITNLQKLGILKLESELMNETDIDSSHSRSKRPRPAIPTAKGEQIWLGLANMYKDIEEYDILRNIFGNVHKTTTATEARKKFYEGMGRAMYLEGQGDLIQARDIFYEFLGLEDAEVFSSTTKLFLEDSTMHCLAKLGDWNDLFSFSEKFSGVSPLEFLHDQNTIDRLIPAQIVSGMHLTLRDEDDIENGNDSTIDSNGVKANIEKFKSFIMEALGSEDGTAFFTARYPIDIGAWLLVEDEESFQTEANLMLERGSEVLLRQMKDLDSLPIKIQRQLLVSLQQSSVVGEYLKWKKHCQKKEEIEERTKAILGTWKKCFGFQPMDFVGSDLIAAHRDRFASKVGIILQEGLSPETLLLSVQEMRVEQDLWLTNLGIYHKNQVTSQQAINRLESCETAHLKAVEFHKCVARYLATFHHILETHGWSKRWRSVWNTIDSLQNSSDISDIKADLLSSLLDVGSNKVNEGFNSKPFIKTLKGNESGSLLDYIRNTAVELMSACDMEQFSSTSSPLYHKLFHLLKQLGSSLPDTMDNAFGEKMLRCLIRGCFDGQANEMLLLSNVFLLLKQFPQLNGTFAEMAGDIPSFMFLPWIDQLLTTYKSSPDVYSSFKKLLYRLATDFPQAFQLQYPEFLGPSGQIFAKALKAIVLPIKLHEASCLEIRYSRTEDQLMTHLIDFQAKLQEIINNPHKIYGEQHTEFATEMFEAVNGVVMEQQRSSGSSSESNKSKDKNLNSSLKECQKNIWTIFDNHRIEHLKSSRMTRIISLEKLSPFLAEFHFFDYDSIERPGLYQDFKRPRVRDHPQIVSFHPTVQIYESITRPIKFTVITNDGKRSNFLAKLGDDLRQDRRIQQLFKMSNILFEMDIEARKRNLNLETYSCIPITEDFGIIEMVDNVMSLVDVIFDTQERLHRRQEMILAYSNWLSQMSGPQSRDLDRYKSCAEKVDRPRAEKFFDQISSKLPMFLFRDSIKKRSSSFQEFFLVRQNMIKAYGALCMVNWLLGIGDRHLENLLVSLRSGKIIGIDFGRAFGTSNYVIQVPEMVPFRLTPQIQHLMMPYTYDGIFREACILSWKCLVDAAEIILTVADVFIREPSLDWLKLRKGSKTGNEDGEENEAEVERNIKTCDDFIPYEIMKRKLQGHNPGQILQEELQLHTKKDLVEIYCNLAQDGRLHKGKEIVTIEEYIDILLNLATDKNILIRIFQGWNSWV